ncbi:hypothetical protein K457DRAFT_17691 [Linnemannia elongata AG-77]|uniref:Uncharacterized protein n=1 Tax=Linnemannia elongata AG-77 TaxID=1314771 RepID=A0A197K1X8_9FUNG|nr:hypothetical protein K457DRAFT_17691 [Linnemannia elongata AG-77]
MASTASSARDIMTDASLKVSETTRDTVSAVRRSGPVQNYIMPALNYTRQKYQSSGPLVKITLMTFAALSAIPMACFAGFMGVVTLGCLIVGGIGFTIVEGGFAMFASAFLLPALGVVCLVSAALELFGLVMYAGYMFTCYVIGLIWGSAPKSNLRGNVQQGADQAQTAAQRATGSS